MTTNWRALGSSEGRLPVVALGSLDGAAIVTAVLQLLGERLDRGKTLPEAIAMPRLSQRNTVVTQTGPGRGRGVGSAFLDEAACVRFFSAGR